MQLTRNEEIYLKHEGTEQNETCGRYEIVPVFQEFKM